MPGSTPPSSAASSSSSSSLYECTKEKKKARVANEHPLHPSHCYKLKMERPGHLGPISKRVRGAVIWRCGDRPLLWLSHSLVPLPPSLRCLSSTHPQHLSPRCQLPAQLQTQDQPRGPDGQKHREKEYKKEKKEREEDFEV